MRWRAPTQLVLALALVGQWPSEARADATSDEAARALFIEGSKLGNQGRWSEALARYAASLALRPAPLTRYSLGVAQRETGHLADALDSFRAFLAEPSSAATMPYVQPAQAAVTELRAEVGGLALTVDPPGIPGLMLTLDGRTVDPTRLSELDPGPHQIIGRAPDFDESTSAFQVRAGALTPLTLTFHPKIAATIGPRSSPPVLSAVLLGAGGGLFVTGVVVGLLGVNEASHAPTRDGPDARAGQSKAIAGDVLAGVGLVAVGVGVAMLVISARSPPPPATITRVSLRGLGSGLTVVF